jgi:integrase
MIADTALIDVCENEFFPLRISIRATNTKYQYRLAIADFSRHLGHTATIADLTDDTVTIWMGRLLSIRPALSVYTVRERVGRILSLWNWLAKRRTVDRFPTVQKPRPTETLPTALTEEQLQRLFASAKKERGQYDNVPADLWWLSYLCFIWMSAERKSAALAVRTEWVNLTGAVVTIPPDVRKGGQKWGVYRLWPESLPLFKQLIDVDPKREFLWPWGRCKESYYIAYNRILKDAGLPITRKFKTHALRVSHATWKTVLGGDATRALMHSDPATTRKHYLDPRLIPADETKLFVPWRGFEMAPPEPPKGVSLESLSEPIVVR